MREDTSLVSYIIDTLFEQYNLDNISLVRGRFPDGEVKAWLYKSRKSSPISLDEHDKLRRAAKSRGGNYSIELCEFVIEQITNEGDVVLNFWRRVRDNTGEGGRMILSCQPQGWGEKQRLGGWASLS